MSAMGEAQELIEKAFDLVGVDGMRTLIMARGKVELTNAILHVYNEGWWTAALETAFTTPTAAQIHLLTRLIDKFLPSPKAVESRTDEPDSFTVIYEQPSGPPA